MSYVVIINGNPITLPASSESPNWAPGIIEFTKAVEAALNSVVGTYDVPPQILNIDAYNPGSNIDITNLSFSTSAVRSAFIRYSVFRTTDSTTAYEAGTMTIVYSPDNSTGNKWEVIRSYVGEGSISFTVLDSGQIQFSTSAISGINHAGKIAYVAQALTQS